MSISALARTLSVLALSLALSACAGDDKAPPKADDKPTPADKTNADEPQPIAGTPVDGEGKVATAEGGTEEKEYNLEIDPVEAKVGEESKVSIRIVPQGVWHMNLEYPTKLIMTAPDGTTIAKPTLAKADAIKLDEKSCEFAVAFTPTDAGSKKFTGEFKFAVCKDEACVPRTEKVEFEVAVK